jgi:hypothetical protein
MVISNDWVSAGIVESIHRKLPALIVAVMENTFPRPDCTFGLGYTTYYAVHAPGRFHRVDGELKYILPPAAAGKCPDFLHTDQ